MESAFFEDFRLKLNACLKAGYDDSVFIPCKRYEFDIPLEQVTGELIAELTRLPHWRATSFLFAPPCGREQAAPLRQRCSTHKNGRKPEHFELCGSVGCSLLALAASYYRLLNADTVDMLYTPGINNWNGFDSIQLRVVSAKAEQPRDIDAYIEKGMRYFCNGLLENLSIGCPN